MSRLKHFIMYINYLDNEIESKLLEYLGSVKTT